MVQFTIPVPRMNGEEKKVPKMFLPQEKLSEFGGFPLVKIRASLEAEGDVGIVLFGGGIFLPRRSYRTKNESETQPGGSFLAHWWASPFSHSQLIRGLNDETLTSNSLPR